MRAMRLTVDLNGEGWTPDTMRIFKARVRKLVEKHMMAGGIVDVLFPPNLSRMDVGMPTVGFVVKVEEAKDRCFHCGEQWEDHRPDTRRGTSPFCRGYAARYLSMLTELERQERQATQESRESPDLSQG